MASRIIGQLGENQTHTVREADPEDACTYGFFKNAAGNPGNVIMGLCINTVVPMPLRFMAQTS